MPTNSKQPPHDPLRMDYERAILEGPKRYGPMPEPVLCCLWPRRMGKTALLSTNLPGSGK